MRETTEKTPGMPEFPQLALDHQLCFPLYAAARRVMSRYTPYFKPLGITYTQFIVFMVLWEMDTATVGDLCHRLYLDNGTITPLLKKMEEAGYITRTRSDRDERVVTVHLTQSGWDMREKMRDIPTQVGSCIPLSLQEAGQLYTLLHKLLEKIE